MDEGNGVHVVLLIFNILNLISLYCSKWDSIIHRIPFFRNVYDKTIVKGVADGI